MIVAVKSKVWKYLRSFKGLETIAGLSLKQKDVHFNRNQLKATITLPTPLDQHYYPTYLVFLSYLTKKVFEHPFG